MRPKRPPKGGARFTEKTELVVELVGNRVAYLGGDDGRSDHHSDKAKGNQKVMHVGISWCESAATVHNWMISFLERNGNPTKTVPRLELVLCQYHLGVRYLERYGERRLAARVRVQGTIRQ